MNNGKVKVGDGEYSMTELTDVVELQARLVPDNWPIEKRECVRLFLSLQEMGAFQLKRHLAYNFKKIVKIALEQQADGEGAEVPVSFSLTIDLRAIQVAALSKLKMSFSQKFSSEGKPVTHDLNQGDFMDQLADVLTTDLAVEMDPPEPTKPEDGKDGDDDHTDKGGLPETTGGNATDDDGKVIAITSETSATGTEPSVPRRGKAGKGKKKGKK